MKVGCMFINGKWKHVARMALRGRFSILPTIGLSPWSPRERRRTRNWRSKRRARRLTKGRGRRCAQRNAPAHLFKLADLIEADAEEFAKLDTRNNGKPLREARFDVADAAGCFRYYAGLITKPLGQNYEVLGPDHRADGRARADRRVRADYPVELSRC